jgi:phenylalanyl-tRNA synthetase alpha subunit
MPKPSEDPSNAEAIERLVRQQLKEESLDLGSSIAQLRVDLSAKDEELRQQLAILRGEVRDRLEEVSKEIQRGQRWEKLDFEELHTYLEHKIEEKLD